MRLEVGSVMGPFLAHQSRYTFGTDVLSLVLTSSFVVSSFIDDGCFKLLLPLFHDQKHKYSVFNVSDVKDKAK